jgi:class 3 adenylate cyclase
MSYPIPDNERERLAALDAYRVAGTAPEMDFNEIAEVAARICGCPVAVVNVVAEKWEWYKGKCGIPEHATREPRGGICCTTICNNDVMVVPDLAADARFADQDIVKGRPHYRFYAGAPMINPDGYALGTLCVLDYAPRQMEPGQIEALRYLTHQAVTQLELRRKVAELDETRAILAEEKRTADELLRNVLPQDIADELKSDGGVRPKYHDAVTILFTDFKDFTRMTERMEPRELIDQLNEYCSAFDDIVRRHGLEKLKTIGDAYMCAAGLPERATDHAHRACAAALDIRDYMARVNADREKLGRPRWDIRIGLHSGGVIAGVVGKDKFAYDIWGDAVNVAALMEAHAEPGQILLSESTSDRVRDRFEITFRNEIHSPKKGPIRCHVLHKANGGTD